MEKSVLFDDCNQCCFYKIFILIMFTCMRFSVRMCIHVSILRKARDIGSSSAQVIGTCELYNTCVVNWTLDLYENKSSSSLLRYLSHPVLGWRIQEQSTYLPEQLGICKMVAVSHNQKGIPKSYEMQIWWHNNRLWDKLTLETGKDCKPHPYHSGLFLL